MLWLRRNLLEEADVKSMVRIKCNNLVTSART